nr:MAG: maturation protein [Leviviridae sp.]
MQYGRYRSQSTANPPSTHWVSNNGSVSTSTWDLPARESRQTYDTVNPDFRRRSAAGEIFNNDFLSVKTNWEFGDSYRARNEAFRTDTGQITSFYEVQRDRFYVDSYLRSGLLPYSEPFIDTAEAERKAQIDALAAVNKTDFDAMTFAGEWQKTKSIHRDVGNALLKLFTGGAKAYVSRARAVKLPVFDEYGRPILNRKGSPVYRYSHVPRQENVAGQTFGKRASDVYLVGRYGVAPLLNDLEGACRFLMRRFHPRFTARGNQSLQASSSVVRQIDDGYGHFNVNIECVRTYDVRCGILYTVDEAARKMAQLGLSRPLSAAWELAPWSFVCDWFLEVGNYLDAIQPSLASKTLSAWGSTRDTVITTFTPSGYVETRPAPAGERWIGTWTGACLKSVVTKRRYVWDASIPSRPALGSGFNAIRSGDFAALMLQRIKAKF